MLVSNKKITGYTILTSDYYVFLADEANSKIKEGWEPLGGVKIISYTIEQSTYREFYQTMVKYAE